jgi:hypothetical protein
VIALVQRGGNNYPVEKSYNAYCKHFLFFCISSLLH